MSRRRWNRLAWAWLAAQGVTGGLAFAGEPSKYSEEWWALRAQDPPGTRQLEKHGKLWPPFPRPVGPKQHWVHQYHHAHYWPHPYNCDDQQYVRSVFDQQAAAGWTTATTLHDYHFDPVTNQLNSVGREHLHWILNFTPAQHRTVYVAQGTVPAVGQLRAANVQAGMRELQADCNVPVLLRPDRSLGRPGSEIDRLRELELQSIPAPRLFTVGGAQGSGSSGGATGGTTGGSSGGNSGSGTR